MRWVPLACVAVVVSACRVAPAHAVEGCHPEQCVIEVVGPPALTSPLTDLECGAVCASIWCGKPVSATQKCFAGGGKYVTCARPDGQSIPDSCLEHFGP